MENLEKGKTLSWDYIPVESIKGLLDSKDNEEKDKIVENLKELIYVIKVNEYKKIRQIDIPNTGYINATCKLNSNIIIIGDDFGSLMKWKIKR